MNSLPEIEQQFKSFLSSINHPFNDAIKFDNGWQSYACPESKNSKTSARYRAFSDGTPTLNFHCFRCEQKENFSYTSPHYQFKLSSSEKQEMLIKKTERELIEIENRDQAFADMNQLWNSSQPCTSHPYFDLKQVIISEKEGFRIAQDGTLLCPVMSENGNLISLQRIFWNQSENKFEKRFFKGVSPKNGYFILGDIASDTEIYFAEGPSTALTILNATNKPVVCVYGKHFDNISLIVANRYPDKKFIFCADQASKNEVHTSEDNAKKAISKVCGAIILPDFSKIPNDLSPNIPRSDFNDLFVLLFENQKNREKALCEVQSQLTAPTLSQQIILNQILHKISSVDFRKRAKLQEDENLQNRHYLIIVIEEILDLAKTNNLGICRNHDFIYLFNSAYWNVLSDEELIAFLGQAAEKMGVDVFKARHFNFRDQLYKQFIALGNLQKAEKQKETVLINLKNGTFEITPNGTKLRPFDPTDFITYQLPFDYNSTAKAPIFHEYLNKVLPEKEKQDILSEFLGYIFIPTSFLKLEKALLLYGKGANGKSVFYEIVRCLLGEQNTSEYSLQSLTDVRGYQRAMLANKLVNYASELSGKLEAALFKQLASNEPVEARLPYGNPFTLINYAKLVFNCNELPKDVEQTEAYFRRFLIIPFDVTIPEAEQDKQLASKIISNELSGVFNWVLNGLNRLLIQKKFTECEAVKQAREQYERESDSVALFLDDNDYSASVSNWIQVKTLYAEYRAFCSEDGFSPVNKSNFITRLKKAKIVIERKNKGNVAFVTKGYDEYRK